MRHPGLAWFARGARRAACCLAGLVTGLAPGLAPGLTLAGTAADGPPAMALLQVRLQALADGSADAAARDAALEAATAVQALAAREVATWSDARAACQRESVGLLGLRALLSHWAESASGAATQANIDASGTSGALRTLDEDIGQARRSHDADRAELQHRRACNEDVGYFLVHPECWTVLRPGASAGEQRLAERVDDLAQSLVFLQHQRRRLLEAQDTRAHAVGQAVEVLQRLNRPLAELDIALKIDARDVTEHQAAIRWWQALADDTAAMARVLRPPPRVVPPATLAGWTQQLQTLRRQQAEQPFSAAPPACAYPPWWQAARFNGPVALVDTAADNGPHRLGTDHQTTLLQGHAPASGRLTVALWLPAHDPQDLCGPGQARYATVWLHGIGPPLVVNHLGTDRPTLRLVELDVPAGPWTLTLQSGESDGCGWPGLRTPPPLLLYARTAPPPADGWRLSAAPTGTAAAPASAARRTAAPAGPSRGCGRRA